VNAQGVITTIAGSGLPGNTGDGGPAAAASLNQPTTLRFDATGNLYVNDSGNRRVRRIQTDGRIVAAPSLPETGPALYSIDAVQRLVRTDPNGTVTLLEPSTPIALPTALVAHGDTLYVADAEQDRVWKLTLTPDPLTLLRIPDRFAPGMIAVFQPYAFTQPEIAFNGTIATLLAQTPTSVAVLVPVELAPGSAELQIRVAGQAITQVSATIAPAAPQLYAAVNEDGTPNSPDTPAARGSILVLYGTGQGILPQSVSVRIFGYAAELLYSGPVAGYPGLWQMNIRVPGGFLPPGTYPLSVSVGNAVSASLEVTVQ
jgi:uncharacterized protein (TIGR03437 family)